MCSYLSAGFKSAVVNDSSQNKQKHVHHIAADLFKGKLVLILPFDVLYIGVIAL